MPDTILRRTTFPHTHSADGKRLLVPCDGRLELMDHDGRVIARCDKCGCGWSIKIQTKAEWS